MVSLGIDIGGTQIKYGAVENGVLLSQQACDTPQGGYAAVLAQLTEILQELRAAYPQAARIGMAVPGVIDSDKGIVRYSNNLNWHEVRLGDDITRAVGLPVRMANDAQCAAFGEALYGAGRGHDRVAMFTVGTGVGGGFVRGGRLETDLYGSMAYIFGHAVLEYEGKACNCGRNGCLEAYASAPALLKYSREKGLPHESVKALFAAAEAGDEASRKVVRAFTGWLSAGFVDIGNILRPQVIVLGGGVSASADQILPEIQQALEKGVYGYEFAPVKAVKAQLGNTAGIIGAASL